MNPLTFTNSKVKNDHQRVVDEIEKIFRMVHATDTNNIEFAAYLFKDVENHWYEEWEQSRVYDANPSLWDKFSSVFPNYFIKKLGEAKAKEFVNPKQ